MNQFKQIFSVSANISNRASLRGSSIARSAGTDGNGSKRSRNFLVATGDSNDSSDIKLCDKSYAKLIVDYGREIEARNGTTRFHGDPRRSRFFAKSPLQRFARVSSLVKITNGRNNSGPCLSTKSSSRPPPNSTNANDNSTKNNIGRDDENIRERAEWLEKTFPNDREEGKYKAHPLVQRIAKLNSAGNVNSNESINANDRRILSVKKIPEVPRSVTKNVSVVVEPHDKSDADKNGLSALASEDKNAMLVTLTEESKFSSGPQSSSLRHIDLRINGKPAVGADAVTRKVEKLDVVRSAEKIEIRIPVVSGATGGDKLRASNSTISVYLSSPGKAASATREGKGKANESGNSEAGNSRSLSWHSSTSSVSKIRNLKKNHSSNDLSKVVPWWTTVESFRRSEKIPVKSILQVVPKKSAIKTAGVGKTAVRVNQEANTAKMKKIAVSDAEMRFKTVVAIPSSPRQSFNTKRKGTSATSKIIENESRKKIEQQRDEQKMRHRVPLKKSKSVAKPEAKHDTKVKSSASNETIKEAPSAAILSPVPGKNIQAETPTSDKFFKKMPSSLGSTVATPRGVSENNVQSGKRKEDRGMNNNLSKANDSRGKTHAKPISEMGKGNTNADIHGRTTCTRRVLNDVGSVSVGSKIGAKPLVEVSSKSVTNDASGLPRTCGNITVLPCAQSVANPVNRPKNDRRVSINPKRNTASTGVKLTKVKNSTITMKPIEKKKDGTLIDYGVTVTTGKKFERKLSGSRSTDGVQRKKITKQEESVVTATIKEVISKRNRDVRGNAINRNMEYPRSKQNGSDKNKQRTSEMDNHCAALQKKGKKTPAKGTINEPNESRTPGTPMNEEKRNSKPSNESQGVEIVSPDKKLLYSIWLRRFKERTGDGHDTTKDPTCRDF